MGLMSKRKGRRGEQELAQMLRAMGFRARRGVQYQGSPDSPDVVGIEGVHLECKRTEALSLYAAMEQAQADAGEELVPVVAHRRNERPWVLCVYLGDMDALARAWLAGKG